MILLPMVVNKHIRDVIVTHSSNEAETLANTLFGGEVKAVDFKTMPGSNADCTPDEMAKALLDSMHRVGLIDGGKLVDKNAS